MRSLLLFTKTFSSSPKRCVSDDSREVQVLKEDSQLKPEVATQIVQKLIEKENVSIITARHTVPISGEPLIDEEASLLFSYCFVCLHIDAAVFCLCARHGI